MTSTKKSASKNSAPTNSSNSSKSSKSSNGKQRTPPKTSGSAYDAFKEFEGKRYTGAKVGRRQKWYYDKGEWKERKVTPDRWEIQYTTPKRRAGRAPEGSGVPVGTEYHWYILAHQFVRKLDANNYTTDMVGVKFKVAHKRADKETWSASDRAQRKRLAAFLREVLAEIESGAEEVPPKSDDAEAPRKPTMRPRAKRGTKRTPRPHKRSRGGAAKTKRTRAKAS
jgi:hypothetical protein